MNLEHRPSQETFKRAKNPLKTLPKSLSQTIHHYPLATRPVHPNPHTVRTHRGMHMGCGTDSLVSICEPEGNVGNPDLHEDDPPHQAQHLQLKLNQLVS